MPARRRVAVIVGIAAVVVAVLVAGVVLAVRGVIPLPGPSGPVTGADLDLRGEPGDPFVIFAPLPPNERLGDVPLPHGSDDYLEMFAEGSDWDEAAARVDAVIIPAWWGRIFASDDDLLTVIDGLAARGIALGMNIEPLEHPDPEVCDQTESFEGIYDFEQVQRIADLGGVIALIDIDEPYGHAHKLTGEGACMRPVDDVAEETAAMVDRIRGLFPDVVVGSFEPTWADPRIDGDDIEIWLDAYERAAGEHFDFICLDVPWEQWDLDELAGVLRDAEAAADARGIPFGVIDIGALDSSTDSEFTSSAAWNLWRAEQYAGITPEVVPIMSWIDRPYRVLPESDPSAFASVVNRYFADRPELSLDLVAAAGGLRASGVLTTGGGEPIPDAVLTVTAETGAVVRQALSVEGAVPPGADHAVIAVRANAEGGIPGEADVLLHEVSLVAGGAADGAAGGEANAVANPDFSAGMDGWGSYGDVAASVVSTDAGPAMAVRAPADRTVFVDSAPFAVTPDAPFTLTVTASASADAVDTVVVSVVFLRADGSEVRRSEVRIAPQPIDLGTASTDESGAFTIDLGPEGSGSESASSEGSASGGGATVTVSYEGDADHWPVRASAHAR